MKEIRNPELIEYKNLVHNKLNEIFGVGKYNRGNQYKWLNKNAPKEHVADMDLEDCKETLELLTNH